MRQVVLDTETTGLEPHLGHRIIEIGCVEVINRKLTGRHYHQYIRPDREVDEEAVQVHGITNEFLEDKPDFSEVVQEFLTFVDGAQLVIHNAPFDIGFLDHELKMLDPALGNMAQRCKVLDSLVMARKKHPGQKNNLDALCKRYGVDNSSRDLHGALLDAEILADVYLLMTGGQSNLALGSGEMSETGEEGAEPIRRAQPMSLQVLRASGDELAAHQQKLQRIEKVSGGNCLWLKEASE